MVEDGVHPLDWTALDVAGFHQVRVHAGTLEVRGTDERSRLLRPLLRHLRLEGNRVVLGERSCVTVTDRVEVDRLTAFECRFLGDTGRPLHPAPHAPAWSPRTDLHTHFAALLPGAALLDVAQEHGVALRPGALAPAGISVDGPTRVEELPADARARLAASLDLPVDRQVTFLEMEAAYRRRTPLTKDVELVVPQLRAGARSLARSGVRYAELSLSSCVEARELALLHQHLDGLEQDTGVRLRFLLALRRHDDWEWDQDMLLRAQDCLASRAVVGVDIMGHETNSTRAFRAVLHEAGRLSALRPGWVVRVHAGENAAYPENVREAVATLLAFPDVQVRIGHGLYGVDDALLERMARESRRVVVEFNLTSNLTLNNIQDTRQVPLRRYLDAGVSVVLGTDGAGLYGTCARDEARTALACGVTEADFPRLRHVEEQVLLQQEERERALPSLGQCHLPLDRRPRFFTDTVAQALDAAREEALRQQAQRLAKLGLPVQDGGVPVTGGRPLLWVAGAWRNAIRTWRAEHAARARDVLDGVVRGVAARQGILVTGGTIHGVEGMVHELARQHGAEVLGAMVRDTLPADLDPRVTRFWRCASTLWEKAAPLVHLVRDAGGVGFFVGGGLIVADEQQAACNLGVRHAVLTGLPGPATAAALAGRRAHPVENAEQVLGYLDQRTPRGHLFHPGPNHAADVVVLRPAPDAGHREVLVIRRHDDSGAHAGRFSLPGGFVLDGETPEQAAVRELAEETGLRVDPARLLPVTQVDGMARDPRNTAERWVHSHVFALELAGPAVLTGGSDAAAALFFPAELHPPLAFDHDHMVRLTLERMTPGRQTRT